MFPTQRSRAQILIGIAVGAMLGALVACILVAAFEAQSGSQFAVDFAPTFGFLAPVAVVIGCVTTPVAWALHGPSRMRFALLLESAKRRFRLLLLGPFLLLGWVSLSHVALLLMTRRFSAAASGVALALLSLTLLACGGTLLDLVATALSRRSRRPSLLLIVAVLLLTLGGGTAALVAAGETSGVGGIFAPFGVFRRQELHLQPVVALGALALAAYGGALVGRRRAVARKAVVGLLALLLTGAVALLTAAAMPSHQALRFERSPALSGRMLMIFQRAADRDQDGLPGSFGGGDCDDHDARVRPGVADVPGNRIDEDCSGSDATTVSAVPAGVAVTEPHAAASARVAKLPDQPNVILLTVDTLRHDLGYTRPEGSRALSPRLDGLATRATVFEKAYALASYTSKSLGPALLGRYPSETSRNFDHFDRFSPDVPFLQERLKRSGAITTYSVQGYWYFFLAGYGFERGWDKIDSAAAPKAISVDADASSNGDKVADRLIAALDELGADPKPFLLWGHWIDPHAEYVKHDKYDFGREPRDRYDGEVAFVDEQVGRVLDALAQSPRAAQTIVIVTSDHGEAFGEHGMIRHGFEVWEELVRVPLLIYVPGVPARKVQERRSLIDLVPTILEAFSVPLPAAGQPDFVRGQSLLDDVLAPVQGKIQERPVLVDMPQGPHNRERRAFLSGDYKLITSDGRVLGLYDLQRDPEEKKDLSEDKALLEKLRQAQAAFEAQLKPLPARR